MARSEDSSTKDSSSDAPRGAIDAHDDPASSEAPSSETPSSETPSSETSANAARRRDAGRALGPAPERKQLGSGGGRALPDRLGAGDRAQPDSPLPFLEGRELSADALRELLAKGSRDDRLWAVSQLLRHAPWSEIWRYVDRAQVASLWDDLDLPQSLRAAWGRQLDLS
ncbi:MAG: hypothetical protein AAGC60_27160 [Acidobacteriota bacterium]